MEVQSPRQIFDMYLPNVMKIHPFGAEFHEGGQMTNLIVAFRNFVNAPKNVWRRSSLVWSCCNDTRANLAQELLFGSWRLLSSYGKCRNKHMGMPCRKPVVLYEVQKVDQEFWSLWLLRTQRNVCSEKNIHVLHYNTFRVCFNGFFFIFPFHNLKNPEKSCHAQFPHYVTFKHENWIGKTD